MLTDDEIVAVLDEQPDDNVYIGSDISEYEDNQEDNDHDTVSKESAGEKESDAENGDDNNDRFFYGKCSHLFKWSGNPPQSLEALI